MAKEEAEKALDEAAKEIDTDDLEAELSRRQKNRERGWKFVVASAFAAAITAWIPNISGWIDAKADQARRTALVDKVANEQVANEQAYRKLSTVLNIHSEDIHQLQSCLVEVATLKEWRQSVDEKLAQRFSIHLPVPGPQPGDPAADMAAPKISTERPAPSADDPKLKKVKQALKLEAL